MVARIVAAFAMLVALLTTRGAAASEGIPGLDRVIERLPVGYVVAQVSGERAWSQPGPDEDCSLLDAQPEQPALSRPQIQPEPDGKHTDADGVAGNDGISLPACAAARCLGQRMAACTWLSFEHSRRSLGVRAVHSARGPPVHVVRAGA